MTKTAVNVHRGESKFGVASNGPGFYAVHRTLPVEMGEPAERPIMAQMKPQASLKERKE